MNASANQMKAAAAVVAGIVGYGVLNTTSSDSKSADELVTDKRGALIRRISENGVKLFEPFSPENNEQYAG